AQLQQVANDPEVRTAVSDLVTKDNLTAQDRERALNLVAAKTGMSRQEVDQQIQQLQQTYQESVQQAREAAETAANVVAQAAIWSFIALVIGAIVGAAAGAAGSPRDLRAPGYRHT
ncbi:MAG: hypothetical protein U0S49_11465, partial [Rhodospirillales bacterium]|nr:hypothetical protein [Rhodospirillales bacterium]